MGNRIQIDFSNLPSEFMDPGKYDAVITEVAYRTSQSGNGYLNWTMEITDGEHMGRKVFLMTSLAPNALFGVRAAFSTLGFDSGDFTEMEVEDEKGLLITPDFVGLPVQVEVIINEYQGQKRNQVKRFTKAYRLYGDTPDLDPEIVPMDVSDLEVEPVSGVDLAFAQAEAMGLSADEIGELPSAPKKKGKKQSELE